MSLCYKNLCAYVPLYLLFGSGTQGLLLGAWNLQPIIGPWNTTDNLIEKMCHQSHALLTQDKNFAMFNDTFKIEAQKVTP
jgi:hypothetical protein